MQVLKKERTFDVVGLSISSVIFGSHFSIGTLLTWNSTVKVMTFTAAWQKILLQYEILFSQLYHYQSSISWQETLHGMFAACSVYFCDTYM